MTGIEATGTGWFRTLGPLFIGGETTLSREGNRTREWRFGLNLGGRSFEWSLVIEETR